jgi:hypothetical protein
VELRNLTPSTTYGVAVRHRDDLGGTSAFRDGDLRNDRYAQDGAARAAVRYRRRRRYGRDGIDVAPLTPGPRINIPVGVSLLLTATDPAMKFEIQHAPDSAGAPNVGAATSIAPTLPGTQRSYHDPQPLDGATPLVPSPPRGLR